MFKLEYETTFFYSKSILMIALIVGTNREGSLSSVLTYWLAGVYKELGIDYKILDLTCLPLEIFSPKAYLEKPEKVKEFTEKNINVKTVTKFHFKNTESPKGDEENIKRILLINSSVTGPFYNSGHWLDKFENKLRMHDVTLCYKQILRIFSRFNLLIIDNNIFSI